MLWEDALDNDMIIRKQNKTKQKEKKRKKLAENPRINVLTY